MLTDKQVDAIPYKAPSSDSIWNTHTTPEIMKVTKVTNPITYKQLLHNNALDETLSPINFITVLSAFDNSLYLGTKQAPINYDILSSQDISGIQRSLKELINTYKSYLSEKDEKLLDIFIEEGVTLNDFYLQQLANYEAYYLKLSQILESKNTKEQSQPGDVE